MKHGLWPPGCDESAFGASPSLFCCFYVSSHFLSLLSQPHSLINCKWCAKASWLLQGFSHPWVKSSISTILSCSNWVGPPSALLFCTSLRSGPEQRLFTQHLEMPSVCFVSQAELWGNVLISAYERVEIHASFCADVWGFHEQNKVCWVATSGHTFPLCPAFSSLPSGTKQVDGVTQISQVSPAGSGGLSYPATTVLALAEGSPGAHLYSSQRCQERWWNLWLSLNSLGRISWHQLFHIQHP